MADKKLSELTELAATPADDDEVYIRDVSEAPADESKRITIANLLAGAALTVAETEVFSGTSPTSWADLDLSGTIGSNTALVLIKVYNPHGSLAIHYNFRRNGDTDAGQNRTSDHAGGATLQVHDFGFFVVATDTGGIIEWIAKTAIVSTTIDVVAYIK